MKMLQSSKKYYSVGIIIILLTSILCTTVLAHSGNTDSYGGHKDRSDNSYHYHHGYSEHQHGTDGWCDITNRIMPLKPGTGNRLYNKPEYSSKSERSNNGVVIGLVILITVVTGIGTVAMSTSVFESNKSIKKAQKNYTKPKTANASPHNNTIAQFTLANAKSGYAKGSITSPVSAFPRTVPKSNVSNREIANSFSDSIPKNISELKKRLESETLSQIAKVPANITYINGKPRDNNDKIYGTYTVYVSKNGARFHQKIGCCSASKPLHIFDVKKTGLFPCSICNTKNSDIPQWHKDYVYLYKLCTDNNIQIKENNKSQVKSTYSANQTEEHQTAQAIVTESQNIIEYLKQNNLRYYDLRQKGGCLWVLGDESIKTNMLYCKQKYGMEFVYTPRGGKSTGYASAWYYRTER